MHVQLFFPNPCFFKARARGTKRGRRTVDDARPTVFSPTLVFSKFEREGQREEEEEKTLGEFALATVEYGMVGTGGKAHSSRMLHALLQGARANVTQAIQISLTFN